MALWILLLLLASVWPLPATGQESGAQDSGLPEVEEAGEPLTLHFFDVGQGDAVLVDAGEHGAVLYDGGASADLALALLEELGIEELSLVIASHPHLDHIGGLPAVLSAYRPAFVLDSGLEHTTRAYERYLEAVLEAESALLDPEPRRLTLGEAELHVIPPPGRGEWGLNDNSVGVLVEYGAFRATLGGDAEEAQWSWWLEKAVLPDGPVQVHKASHHGSRNGDTQEGMARLRPEVIVTGVSPDNQYGHPHPEALAIYAAVGAEVYRTDRHGTVTITAWLDGSFQVTVERDRE